jgi:hypothetical protein
MPSIVSIHPESAALRVQATCEPRWNGVPQHRICQLSTHTVMPMSQSLAARSQLVELFPLMHAARVECHSRDETLAMPTYSRQSRTLPVEA